MGRDGKPAVELPLQLSIAGDTRWLTLRNRPKTRTNAKGEFEFRALPPGEYRLGHDLYPENDPTFAENGVVPARRSPTFYPGIADRDAAIQIAVGEGTDHSGLDFAVVW